MLFYSNEFLLANTDILSYFSNGSVLLTIVMRFSCSRKLNTIAHENCHALTYRTNYCVGFRAKRYSKLRKARGLRNNTVSNTKFLHTQFNDYVSYHN